MWLKWPQDTWTYGKMGWSRLKNAVDGARLDYGKSDIARILQAISTFCSSDIARILVLYAISATNGIIEGSLKFKEPFIILLVADIADKTNIRAISKQYPNYKKSILLAISEQYPTFRNIIAPRQPHFSVYFSPFSRLSKCIEATSTTRSFAAFPNQANERRRQEADIQRRAKEVQEKRKMTLWK